MSEIKFLAYYLPQFHPIPENDNWWGKGFTEWTNVTRAKPLFRGHHQPKLPGELGFYDLRVPEIQKQQADLANKFGVDGFIYYQYWFGNGKMLLEKPAEQMLRDPKVKTPFCFCWANETWRGIWHGIKDDKVLIRQEYLGIKDYKQYFEYLLPFFRDKRYIKVENKPMFHIYKIQNIPDLALFLKLFNKLAVDAGFNGIYFISSVVNHPNVALKYKEIYGQTGLDIFQKIRYEQDFLISHKWYKKISNKVRKLLKLPKPEPGNQHPVICDYRKGVKRMEINFPNDKYIPCVFPNWDNSPRSGKRSLIFKNSTPELWEEHLRTTVKELQRNKNNPSFIFIKSWNEWAEGNYLEPDQLYGREWLKVVKRVKETLIYPKNIE